MCSPGNISAVSSSAAAWASGAPSTPGRRSHMQRRRVSISSSTSSGDWFGQASSTARPRKGQQAENGFSRRRVEWPAAPAGPVE